MRNKKQIEAGAQAFVHGNTKTDAMIAMGFSPQWAGTNSYRVFGPGQNQRHLKFAFGLAMGLSHAEAARRAGYSRKSCHTNATRLLKHQDVHAAWNEIVRKTS